MKLAELRKLSIRQHSKIHFRLRNGMECVVSEHGIAQVPGLRGIPDFNLEEELAAASEFLLEPAAVVDKKDRKSAPQPRSMTREELVGLTSASSSAGTPPEHEDE